MSATAVLSYTRKDDEFFGGYITSFRKSLEIGVHVVTGDESFRLFQDIDGIVIGDQWKKRIAEVIDESTFLVPMVSPLFFNSQPCRDEVNLFLQHERTLQRSDLILPVYFIECPKLEKPEETAKDPIATEIDRRDRFDWREKASIGLGEPAARKAILELAGEIAQALRRVAGSAPPDTRGAREPRPRPESVSEAHRAGFEAASRSVGLEASTRRETPAVRTVLWVDDNPGNNGRERRALETYGVRFVLATSTDDALPLLGSRSFDAIISDMGRPGDSRAGFTLLDQVRARDRTVPYFIYCGRQASALLAEGKQRGANDVTNDPDRLISGVVSALR